MPTDAERRAQNKAVLRHYYTHMFEVVEGGIDEVKKYKTEDATSWTPFGGGERQPGQNYGFAGMQTVPNTFRFWRHEIVNIFESTDPDLFVVEADAVGRTRLLDLDYDQRYVMVFRFRDGKLCENKEYFNSDTVQVLLREHQHRARIEAGGA